MVPNSTEHSYCMLAFKCGYFNYFNIEHTYVERSMRMLKIEISVLEDRGNKNVRSQVRVRTLILFSP